MLGANEGRGVGTQLKWVRRFQDQVLEQGGLGALNVRAPTELVGHSQSQCAWGAFLVAGQHTESSGIFQKKITTELHGTTFQHDCCWRSCWGVPLLESKLL